MRIPSNSIGDIISFFKNELKDLYNDKELNNIILWTLEHYTGLTKTRLLIQKESRVSESVLLKIKFAINDLKKLRPIQYILGETEFCNLNFVVNENVLIPRPETEELVKWITDDNKGSDCLSLLDIGTGSGCIAISISNIMKNWKIDGFDISEKAVEVAVENNKKNNSSVSFSVFDILNKSNWDKAGNYDIIVSNPPYIPEKEKASMSKNVTEFEPDIALFVPDDSPFVFYEKISDFALEKLNNNGQVYFEIHENYSQELLKIFEKKNFKEVQIRNDINNKPRMMKLQK
jgi:release factor glutamine methyltransferase